MGTNSEIKRKRRSGVSRLFLDGLGSWSGSMFFRLRLAVGSGLSPCLDFIIGKEFRYSEQSWAPNNPTLQKDLSLNQLGAGLTGWSRGSLGCYTQLVGCSRRRSRVSHPLLAGFEVFRWVRALRLRTLGVGLGLRREGCFDLIIEKGVTSVKYQTECFNVPECFLARTIVANRIDGPIL